MSQLLEYKCPNCGGAIEFDSTIQKMKCPYCDSEFDVAALKENDDILNGGEQVEMEWDTNSQDEWDTSEADGMSVYVCRSCGGEIVCDDDTVASSCPFCDNPVVMTGKLSGALKPDAIIPFKLDKEAAKDAFKSYLLDKRLLPSVFKAESHIDEIKGVYVPVWLYDADVAAEYNFNATKENIWSDSSYRYTETSHYNLTRSGQFDFSAVPVAGTDKIDRDMLESLEPFEADGIVDFQTAYLAGYVADKYEKTADDCVAHANDRIAESIEDMLRSSVDGEYSISDTTKRSIRFNNGKVRYALYPVWLMTTTWNDKLYTFAMNGQTGKFVGDLPMDDKKYWGWFGGIAAVCAIAIYLIARFLWSC